MTPIKFLVISKKNEFVDRVRKIISTNNTPKKYELVCETNIEEVFNLLEKRFDIILLEITPEDSRTDIKKVIRAVKSKGSNTQIISLAEPESVKLAIETLKTGAYQYAKLPATDNEILQLIQSAEKVVPGNGKHSSGNGQHAGLEELQGASLAMQKVYSQLIKAAQTDIPVLLLGETGTGKDLAAQAIHKLSSRADNNYIASNLGAFPKELVASELFGHEKGAFTGASDRRKGLFEQAKNGTLFLDEIDAVEPRTQVSLLRLLEENRYSRIGGETSIKNDARLIAASNQNLEKMVKDGDFRRDLFFRLDVFRITMPPLRERLGDITLLAQKFLRQFNKTLNKQIYDITPEALEYLNSYDWPGNVRELKNVIQRGMITCDDKSLRPENLPSRLVASEPTPPAVVFEIGTPIEQVEREMIIHTLASVNNNRKQAAKLLGISRRAIYNKFEKHKI